jgi:hypothetical protein
LPELFNFKHIFMPTDQIKNAATPRVTGIGGIFFYPKILKGRVNGMVKT